jgi:hypothetical protein
MMPSIATKRHLERNLEDHPDHHGEIKMLTPLDI